MISNINLATAINPSNQIANSQPSSNVVNHSTNIVLNTTINATNTRKRKFNAVCQDDDSPYESDEDDCPYESDDDNLTIITGFEDGILSKILSEKAVIDDRTNHVIDDDDDAILNQLINERFENQENKLERVKQTADETRGVDSTVNLEDKVGDIKRQLNF